MTMHSGGVCFLKKKHHVVKYRLSVLLFTAPDNDEESWKTPVKVFSEKRRGKHKEDKKLTRRMRYVVP